jgi:signal transduction histidine kinase
LDRKLMRQVLVNLLSNAIKYSPQGGNISFNLIIRNDNVTFKIQDEGIGIPLDEQAQIFEAFYRAQNVGTIPGTGLGLAIAKKCVNLHGGSIFVNSQTSMGTLVIVTLPC